MKLSTLIRSVCRVGLDLGVLVIVGPRTTAKVDRFDDKRVKEKRRQKVKRGEVECRVFKRLQALQSQCGWLTGLKSTLSRSNHANDDENGRYYNVANAC